MAAVAESKVATVAVTEGRAALMVALVPTVETAGKAWVDWRAGVEAAIMEATEAPVVGQLQGAQPTRREQGRMQAVEHARARGQTTSTLAMERAFAVSSPSSSRQRLTRVRGVGRRYFFPVWTFN